MVRPYHRNSHSPSFFSRKRPGETGIIPYCLNITGTLSAHADMLVSAGVDYVAVDSTNLPTFDDGSDLLQVWRTDSVMV